MNCRGKLSSKLVAKYLCKLASFIKSIWHLVSPSYDSKISIYSLNYWCTWLTMLAMSSRHYYAKHFALMLAIFAKFFVQCTIGTLLSKLLVIYQIHHTCLLPKSLLYSTVSALIFCLPNSYITTGILSNYNVN